MDRNRLELDEQPAQELFRILRKDVDLTAPDGQHRRIVRRQSTDKAGSGSDAGAGTPTPKTDNGGAAAGAHHAGQRTHGRPGTAPAFDPAVQPVQVVNASGVADRGEELSKQLHALGYLLATAGGRRAERPTTQLYYSAGFEHGCPVPWPRNCTFPTRPTCWSPDDRQLDGARSRWARTSPSGKQLAKTGGVAGGFKGQTADQVTCQQSGAF